MTQEQMAELYDLSVGSVQYRLKHGIPVDSPKRQGNRTSRGGRPKGVAPTTVCSAGHNHPVRCKICPECKHEA